MASEVRLNGILLYVVSAVFITYLSVGAKMGNLSIPNWNALYWIIILFFGSQRSCKKLCTGASGPTIVLLHDCLA